LITNQPRHSTTIVSEAQLKKIMQLPNFEELDILKGCKIITVCIDDRFESHLDDPVCRPPASPPFSRVYVVPTGNLKDKNLSGDFRKAVVKQIKSGS